MTIEVDCEFYFPVRSQQSEKGLSLSATPFSMVTCRRRRRRRLVNSTLSFLHHGQDQACLSQGPTQVGSRAEHHLLTQKLQAFLSLLPSIYRDVISFKYVSKASASLPSTPQIFRYFLPIRVSLSPPTLFPVSLILP